MDLDDKLKLALSYIREGRKEKSKTLVVIDYMILFMVDVGKLEIFDKEKIIATHNKALKDIENGHIQYYINMIKCEIENITDPYAITKGKNVIDGLKYLSCN